MTDNYTKFLQLFNQCKYNGWKIDGRPNIFLQITKQISLVHFIQVRYDYEKDSYELVYFKNLDWRRKDSPTLEDIIQYLNPVQVSLFDIETNY